MWYESGQLESDCPYRDNRKHCVYRQWYPSGKLHEETTYNIGVQDGVSRLYFPNGKVEQAASYRNGKMTGRLQIWDRQGNLAESTPNYWLDDQQVTREAYLKACITDPSPGAYIGK